jgi:hypothetical protein
VPADRPAPEEDYVRLAVVMLAFACYSAAETIRVLMRTNVTWHLPTMVRVQFEAAVTASYIVSIHPKKARDFILLDSFDRLDLAREADLSAQRKAELEAECRETSRLYPDVIKRLKNGAEIMAGKIAIDAKAMKAIRDKLDFPDVRAMMKELEKKDAGFSGGLYTIVFRFGSLTAHPSIISLRRIFNHFDGVSPTTPSLGLQEPGAPDYTLQGLSNVIGLGMILDRVAHLRPSEGRDDAWKSVRQRQEELVKELHATLASL